MSGQVRNYVDVVVPWSHYKFLKDSETLTMIAAVDDPSIPTPDFDSLVRMVVFHDVDFHKHLSGQSPNEITPEFMEFYDLNYIRECRLKSVHPAEWAQNYGTDNPQDFIAFFRLQEGLNARVKVFYMRKTNKSLKELNQEFGPINRYR